MKIKVGELLELNKVINDLSDTKLNTILAYKFARILKKVALEIAVIEENRTNLIMPYVTKNEKGEPVINDGVYAIAQENQNELAIKLNDFFITEIEVDLPTITIHEMSELEITPRQMEIIMPIIDEEDK